MELDIELLKRIDRIHPYPAKFPINLAIDYISEYTSIGDTVYDPFLGSGTTTLASSVLDRNGYGTDINHIAILISKFKLLNLSKDDLSDLYSFIVNFERDANCLVENAEEFSYPSIEHWFCKNSIKVLSAIKYEIQKLDTNEKQLFCNLVFSSIINTVSNQDSDTRYAAVEKEGLTIDRITEIFVKKFRSIFSLFAEFLKVPRNTKEQKVFLQDSKRCDDVVPANSVDMILTSPPYPNTYDYYLYHKHRMNWLEYDVKYSMNAEIGSRREFSSLKAPKEKFNSDLFEIFSACNKVLKSGGYSVIVIGDGKIHGCIYDAKSNIEELAKQLEWELVDYKYTMLDDTSRSFQQSYRTKEKKEHVLVFRKR